MRNKKEQIPVQRLYMDRNQNRYKNIIWITFLALLLTGGIFLVIRESWKGQLSALPVCILTAGAGILCCVLAEIMRERMRFATAIAGLPWIVLLVFTGVFRGGWTGAQAWINMLISQWNTANAGGLALFSVQASMHDAFVFTLILVLAVAEISWFLADGRHLLLANIFCILWVILQLLCGVLNPAACGFLFAALCGMCVSDDEMIFTRNRAGWTIGVLIVFCIFGRVVSEEPAYKIGVTDVFAATFSGHAKELREAFLKLNGTELPQGDVGYQINAFECEPMRFYFWDCDDEFEAQGNILFDYSATDFNHVESAVSTAEMGVKRLAELAGLPLRGKSFGMQ